jgi:hypothetical protein
MKASKSIVTKTKQTAIINSLLQRFKKRNDQDIDEKLDQVRQGNLSIFCAVLDKIVCKRTMKQVMKEVEKQTNVPQDDQSIEEYLAKVLLPKPNYQSTQQLQQLLLRYQQKK